MPDAPLETRVRVSLRWRDMDALGHVNQSVYHELLEEGRAALFLSAGDQVMWPFVLVRIELDYVRELRRDHEEAEVVVRVASLGTSSVTVEHEVLRPDGEVAARGRSVLVAWDPHTRGKRALTDGERAALG